MATKTPLQILMSQMGFGSGFRLPVANEENQRLEKLLEEKQQHLLEVRGHAEDEKRHNEDYRQHLTRVTTEISFQKKIIQTKKTTLNSDEENVARNQAHFNNLEHELSKTKQKCNEVKTKNLSSIQQLEKRKEWLETTKAKKARYKMALDDLKHAIQNKEKDIDYILDLMKVDDKAVREFEHKYDKLDEELNASKKELNNLFHVTQTLVVRYEQEVSRFRQVHKERNKAVEVWEHSVESLKSRDTAIKEIAQKYRVVCARIRKIENEIDKKRILVDFGKSDTHEVEYRITYLDRQMPQIRSAIREENELMKLLQTEIASMQTTSRSLSSSLKQTIENIQTVDNEITTMESRTMEVTRAIKSMKDHLNETSNEGTLKLKSMTDLIDAEEQKMNRLRERLDSLQKFRFDKQGQVLILKGELHQAQLKVIDKENTFKRLRLKAKLETINLHSVRKLYFELANTVANLQRRIEEVEQPPEVNELMLDTQKRAKEELLELDKDRSFLLSQKTHMESCNWRIRKEIDEIINVKRNLLIVVADNSFLNKILLKELESSSKTLKDTEIEYSLVKLTHHRLANMATEQRESHFSLEQFRLFICTSIQQRKSEVETLLSLLRAQIRVKRDEKSKLVSDRSQGLIEIKKKKNIYEMLTESMASSEERAKTEYTEAYIIIKHAQEKETVRREGDVWDKRVKEAEKETMALQNTLALMKSSNNSFKESLAPVVVGTQDYEHMKMLEHKLLEAKVRKQTADKALRAISKEYAEKESKLVEINNEIDRIKGNLSDKRYQLNAIGFEIKKQKDKIDRANKAAFRTQKSFKNQPPAEKIHIEAELKLIFSQDKFNYALQMLDRAIQAHCELRTPVLEFLNQKPSLQNVAKHLEKFGKCISAEVSRPLTPQRKLYLNKAGVSRPSVQISDPELIRSQHRYLKHISSVFEKRETNVTKQESLDYGKSRRTLHDAIVDEFDGTRTKQRLAQLKSISSSKTKPNISNVQTDIKKSSGASSAASVRSYGLRFSRENGESDASLKIIRKASY